MATVANGWIGRLFNLKLALDRQRLDPENIFFQNQAGFSPMLLFPRGEQLIGIISNFFNAIGTLPPPLLTPFPAVKNYSPQKHNRGELLIIHTLLIHYLCFIYTSSILHALRAVFKKRVFTTCEGILILQNFVFNIVMSEGISPKGARAGKGHGQELSENCVCIVSLYRPLSFFVGYKFM
ncbi:MAG: hypothetical protein ABI594_15340 [Ginsengibacter sp.]